MTTRADYRADLTAKLTAAADLNLGTSDLNLCLELGMARLYPDLHKKVQVSSQAVTEYGTRNLAQFSTAFAETVYLVEDATELDPVSGWSVRPGKIVGLDRYCLTGDVVNFAYTTPYTMPSSDGTAVDWGDQYQPLVVLAAGVEALDMVIAARADTNTYYAIQVRQGVSEEELSLLSDSWERRLLRLLERMGHDLPVVQR